MSELGARYSVVVDIDAPAAHIRDLYGTWVEVTDLSRGRCGMTTDTDTFRWPTYVITDLETACTIIGPPEFRRHLTDAAARLRRAGRTTN